MKILTWAQYRESIENEEAIREVDKVEKAFKLFDTFIDVIFTYLWASSKCRAHDE